MSAVPSLLADFLKIEKIVEAQPEGVRAEIARGLLLKSPRPVVRHSAAQGRLNAWLQRSFGEPEGNARPDWLFLVEPELRSESAYSRLVPDLAGWRRSSTGWPGADEALIELAPDWAAEILSPSTAADDRGAKRGAYGLMGVGWLWIVDPLKRTIEVHENVRGKMIARSSFGPDISLEAEPFLGAAVKVETLFLPVA